MELCTYHVYLRPPALAGTAATLVHQNLTNFPLISANFPAGGASSTPSNRQSPGIHTTGNTCQISAHLRSNPSRLPRTHTTGELVKSHPIFRSDPGRNPAQQPTFKAFQAPTVPFPMVTSLACYRTTARIFLGGGGIGRLREKTKKKIT